MNTFGSVPTQEGNILDTNNLDTATIPGYRGQSTLGVSVADNQSIRLLQNDYITPASHAFHRAQVAGGHPVKMVAGGGFNIHQQQQWTGMPMQFHPSLTYPTNCHPTHRYSNNSTPYAVGLNFGVHSSLANHF